MVDYLYTPVVPLPNYGVFGLSILVERNYMSISTALQI